MFLTVEKDGCPIKGSFQTIQHVLCVCGVSESMTGDSQTKNKNPKKKFCCVSMLNRQIIPLSLPSVFSASVKKKKCIYTTSKACCKLIL